MGWRSFAPLLAMGAVSVFSGCTSGTKVSTAPGGVTPGGTVVAQAPGQHPVQGGEVSGGADSFVIAPAYFRSNDPLKQVGICYEVAAGFGVPDDQIESAISSAFQSWSAYIEAKDLHYAASNGETIVEKFKLTKGCHDEDLKIYLGVSNGDVVKFRPHYENPYAFSAITDASDRLWEKGFVWIAQPGSVIPAKGIPTWSNPQPPLGGIEPGPPFGAFRYVMLHEMGHVFGCGHFDWTIMTPRIGQFLEMWTAPGWNYGPKIPDIVIDQVLDLVPNLGLAEDFVLADAYGHVGNTSPDSNALSKAFTRIFKQQPQGALKAIAHRLENPARGSEKPEYSSGPTAPVQLEFTDSAGTHHAMIITTRLVGRDIESIPLFDGQHGNHYDPFASSYLGYIETDQGKQFQVIVNYNMGNRFEVIDIEQGIEDYPLLTVK